MRDPRENIGSILDRLGLPTDLPDLTRDDPARLPERWVEFPRSLGPPDGSYIDTLVRYWCLQADVPLEHGKVACMHYEDFTADPNNATAALAHKLALEPMDDVGGVLSPQFHPRGANRDVPGQEFFGTNRAVIEQICGSRMDRVAYQRAGTRRGHG